ncbi:hypothetical protein [Hymenobacter antarcticus]|uniref:Uncharacterized protein n=1 Tax=Hymenobacter antarcticus TaxID=486270 RepID=A0ABP7R7C0_9BACT
MKLTHTLLLALATVALASCSAEPSDWRPGEKVSVDMVAPGTRASENFDGSTPNGSIENKSAETQEAEEAAAPARSAESSISANAEEGMRKRGQVIDAGKSSQADTADNGHQIQR